MRGCYLAGKAKATQSVVVSSFLPPTLSLSLAQFGTAQRWRPMRSSETNYNVVQMCQSSYLKKILRPHTLRNAFARVRVNGGAAGGDGRSAEDLAPRLDTEIARLSTRVECGTYRPGPLRNVIVPKATGDVRLLRIPPVIDRILQGAANMILIPLLDRSMHKGSYGYRPGRSVHMALRELRRCRGWVLDGDIEIFFDSVAHAPLQRELRRHLSCRATLRLIDLWLQSFGPRGLAIGAPISPLLANIALGPLDIALSKYGRLIRYADDFVVVCPDQPTAEAAQNEAARVLRAGGLRLHSDKTRILPPETPFDFLGERVTLKQHPHRRSRKGNRHLRTRHLLVMFRGRRIRVGGLVGLIWKGIKKR